VLWEGEGRMECRGSNRAAGGTGCGMVAVGGGEGGASDGNALGFDGAGANGM
jgi:hypothetical protein